MDAMKILVPLLSVVISSVVTWKIATILHARKRADDVADRAEDKAAEIERERRARAWAVHKRDHEDAQQLLDRVDRICRKVSITPQTAGGLAELGVEELIVDLSQVLGKMPEGEACESLWHVQRHVALINGRPLPVADVDGRVDVGHVANSACLQGREAAWVLSRLSDVREDVTQLWGPPAPQDR